MCVARRFVLDLLATIPWDAFSGSASSEYGSGSTTAADGSNSLGDVVPKSLKMLR